MLPVSHPLGATIPAGDELSASNPPRKYDPARRGVTQALVAAAALVVTGAALFVLLRAAGSRPDATAKPSVAVLYFENFTGDPSLDWLRRGLAEMFVTDLSQSRGVRVLGMDGLFFILKRAGRQDGGAWSPDLVRLVGHEARVDTVLLGSYAKAGESWRIHIRLEDAQTGEILAADRAEGTGASSLFELVDALSERVRFSLELPADDAGLVRDLKEVTTSSLEAYRHYAEALHQQYRLNDGEAIALYERAVELDPGFATALAKLSILYANRSQQEKAEACARRAMERAGRLPPRERYYVEGNFYLMREETYHRAIEAYRQALAVYPDHISARHNLGAVYFRLERYERAIEELEELTRRGVAYPASYNFLALAYAARGEFDKGHRALAEFERRHPESWTAHRNLARHFLSWGKLENAERAFAKAEQLRWGSMEPQDRWQLALLRENGAGTRGRAARGEPSPRTCTIQSPALDALYRGQSAQALQWIEASLHARNEPGDWKAAARNLAAHVLLESGSHEAALAHALGAQKEGRGTVQEWVGLYFAALAQARAGRRDEAERSAGTLRAAAAAFPSERERRRFHHLAGELALERGEVERAIAELELAQSLLPARGFPARNLEPWHVPIWFSLATAYLAAGDESRAADWLERITRSDSERLAWPILYVRSFYLLGKIHERRGERAEANALFERFARWWKDGDLDRDRITEVERRVGIRAAKPL